MTENSIKNKVDQLFERWNKKKSPGCVIGVIKDGKFLYKKGYGMANLDYDIPITPQTVFRIASVSKQFTAFSIMLLIKEGKIRLDDDIRKYFPEMPEYERIITIRHLIHHTSGIRDCYELFYLKGYDDFGMDFLTNKIIIDILSQQNALMFLPGEGCSYSNSGYILLAIVIERVSGKTLRQFTEEFIFKPLGMVHTHFHDDRTMIVKNRATGYSQDFDGTFKINETNFQIVGDGGLFTTIDDFQLWEKNFYYPTVGDREIFDQMTTPGLLNNGMNAQEFGENSAFGLFIGEYRGLKKITHGGVWVGFRSIMLRFPKYKLSIICFSNLAQLLRTELVRRVADIYLKDEFPVKERETVETTSKIATIETDEAEIKKFAGFYHDEKNGDIFEILIKNRKLHAIFNESAYALKLDAIDKFKFRSLAGHFPAIYEFQPISDGFKMIRFLPAPYGMQTFNKLEKFEYTDELLKEYIGKYYSDEIDCYHAYIIEDNRLKLSINDINPTSLFLVKNDIFWDGIHRTTIIFKRDHEKQVTGFIVNMWLAKGVQFNRE